MGRNPFEETATAGGRPAYSAPYSQPQPWGGQTSGGGNRPPTERVWEEDKEDKTPIVTTNQIINEPIEPDARSTFLKSEAEKSAEKYRTGIAEMATDEYGRLRNIYDLETNEPLLTFEDGKVVRGDEGGVYRDEYRQFRDPEYVPGKIGDKGALLSDYERMQLAALKLGHLTSLGDPVSRQAYDQGNALNQLIAGTDEDGNPIYTGLGQLVSDNWNKLITGYDDPSGYGQGDMLQDMTETTSFDDWWYNDPGTPWEQEWYDYPGGTDETVTAQLPHWRSEALPTESISMGEREQMYDRELRKERMASPIFMAGMEDISGIPYQGRPEFGTIEMPG